jgi:hypothetical protein
MQRFKAVLNIEDKTAARRAGRIALLVYTAIALALTAAVLAHIAFKTPAAGDAALEIPTRFVQTGCGS